MEVKTKFNRGDKVYFIDEDKGIQWGIIVGYNFRATTYWNPDHQYMAIFSDPSLGVDKFNTPDGPLYISEYKYKLFYTLGVKDKETNKWEHKPWVEEENIFLNLCSPCKVCPYFKSNEDRD